MKRFSTFEGVFTPCLLSILGVIMYLRLGWVIGNVGLGQALSIILFANLITLATALSMSSIVSNIRIGTGGAYSIIKKSLGVEAGGAIGIPLYLSQAISVAFYITGFMECWRFVFPDHNGQIVCLITWAALLIVCYVSARLAFRIQYVIMFVIFLSLISILLTKQGAQSNLLIWHNFKAGSFWPVFAVFFPAVTGVLAGATMSGELNDPKRSLAVGTLWAIGVSFVIYIFLACWLAYHVSSDQLVENTAVLISLGRWQWLIVAGIMGATLSSALSMFVGSPRTLLALGKHTVVPFSDSFSKINKRGEPTAAILFTSLIVLATLLLGTLNKVAALLTMFFLITYGMINISVFVEQSIGIASFRPSFKIPKLVSLFGSIGCVVVMFLLNPWFSVISISIIVVAYLFFVRREVKVYSPDVRSGLLVFIAEKLAKMSARLPYHPKIWKPNLLIPVYDIEELSVLIPFINTIVAPNGRTIFCKVLLEDETIKIKTEIEQKQQKAPDDIREYESDRLSLMTAPLKESGLFIETAVVEAQDSLSGMLTVMQTLKGMFFPPNTLFCLLSEEKDKDETLKGLIREASLEGLGVMVMRYNQQRGFSAKTDINLWVRQKSPNIDLSVLTALQVRKNWEGRINIVQAVDTPEDAKDAREYLEKLKKLIRMPMDVEVDVLIGEFKHVLFKAPKADINIFGMPREPDLEMIRDVFNSMQTTVLFLRDSEHESAVA